MRATSRLFALALLASFPLWVSAEVVYGNTSHRVIGLHWTFLHGTPEVADRILLGGSQRTLSAVTCWLYANTDGAPGTVDVTYRIRSVAGDGTPGAVLSQSTVLGQTFPPMEFSLRMDMLSVALPEEVFVTAQLSNAQSLGTDSYGVLFANPPEIGASDAESFYTNFGGWVLNNGQGRGFGNMQARVEAVPEPVTLVALAFGLGAFWRRRRP